MAKNAKLKIAKDLIESGKIKTFEDIFLYVTRSEISKKLGINYTRFLTLIKNPKKLRYDETYSLANILDVQAKNISELIHNQLDAKKTEKGKNK